MVLVNLLLFFQELRIFYIFFDKIDARPAITQYQFYRLTLSEAHQLQQNVISIGIEQIDNLKF